jgi:hypothetical protein
LVAGHANLLIDSLHLWAGVVKNFSRLPSARKLVRQSGNVLSFHFRAHGSTDIVGRRIGGRGL